MMKTSSLLGKEFSKFKEYYIRECNECGICYKNCFAYNNTKYPIYKYLKSLFQKKLDKKNVKKIKKFSGRKDLFIGKLDDLTSFNDK